MNRRTICLALLVLSIAACRRSPEVSYDAKGYADAPAMAPRPTPAPTASDAARAVRPVPHAPNALNRFERDFGTPGRFVYRNNFRLDTWTGCVSDSRTGVPILDNRNEPECGYFDRKPDHG